MITDPYMPVDEAVKNARDSNDDYMVACPAHIDPTASLHVTPGDTKGTVLVYCHAGCPTRDVLDAAGLTFTDLAPEPDPHQPGRHRWTPGGDASAVYPYNDEAGVLLYEVLRVPQPGGKKTFYQRRPTTDQTRPYEWKLGDTRRVPYRLPQTLAAIAAGQLIYVPEGEKDADTLAAHGHPATCNSGGAGKWQPGYGALLAGGRFAVICDADPPGRAHGRAVADNLRNNGCTVAVMEPPAPHKDVTDLLSHGGALTDLLTVVPFETRHRVKTGVDVLDLVRRNPEAVEWVQPGIMARRERLLLVGLEGHGKSTLMRQMAVMCAAGLSWWSTREVEPVRALVIDGENEPDQYLQSWQELVGLAEQWNRPVERGQLTVLEEWDSDIDLAAPEGTSWLHERVHAYRPDIVFMGPMTNFVGRDLKDDEPVRRMRDAVNSMRAISGCAVVMEHHAPHKNPNDKVRAVRPYGSSLFLRWPDYVYGMAPHLTEQGTYWWQRMRWPRVRTRTWPTALRWGAPGGVEWPWQETIPPEEQRR